MYEERGHLHKRIERQSDSDLAYLDTASLIFDLFQAAIAIYLKGNPEQKRQIFSHVFEKLVIRGNVLEATYTKPYWLISQAVEQTNRSKGVKLGEIPKFIFEHQVIDSVNKKDQPLGVDHPCWLASWFDFRTYFISKA